MSFFLCIARLRDLTSVADLVAQIGARAGFIGRPAGKNVWRFDIFDVSDRFLTFGCWHVWRWDILTELSREGGGGLLCTGMA